MATIIENPNGFSYEDITEIANGMELGDHIRSFANAGHIQYCFEKGDIFLCISVSGMHEAHVIRHKT